MIDKQLLEDAKAGNVEALTIKGSGVDLKF